ncbi:adenosylmethionine--8-amino-7-oxononanoate transaminase [Rothia nasimurium]|uniref:adenosylmethionine--8-amino-7-oxononanoate transaminase n=1 Tax=Rothia nasimurium TaxID=85336 RepID=UPI0016235694|nr:adenosylmethionine--8-amino-7-oxononanoate transaminase [Rothia nasimurium]
MFKKTYAPAKSLIERDRGLLWHPYAPLESRPLYAVTEAQGSVITLQSAEGATYSALDAMSSWWCQVHGYRNPALDRALAEQAARFSHVMFGGLTHQPAIELAERLVALSPEGLNHVFLADSGSISVEVALKLAVQYQSALGKPERRRFIALEGGYHGDTIGAMGVSDPAGSMHRDFSHLVTSQFFVPRPPAARYLPQSDTWECDEAEQMQWEETVSTLVGHYAQESAALILEPVVQGAGGMFFYHPRCLNHLRALADEHGLLLIFDEIATGFGRTGRLFAAEWAGVTPDVMTVGKALTGGYLTQAATLVTSPVADVISNSVHKALMHGPTFMGNPLASAVSCASLDLLTGALPADEGYPSSLWSDQVPVIGENLHRALAPARELEIVQDVRVLGAIGVVELVQDVDIPAVTECALEAGVWVRPFRKTVYTMPTYISSPHDVERIGAGICSALERVYG